VPFAPIQHIGNMLDEREGLCVQGDWGHVSVLLGGGHICQLVSIKHPDINPLWQPQWRTIDPERYSAEEHREEYGPPPDGRLLSGIAGHSLSFDIFGPPSEEETEAGLSTHGEAPAVSWQMFQQYEANYPGVEYGARLPFAQIDFRRSLRIDKTHPVVYCQETARNLSPVDRPICWNEHVTMGPPFLECGTTIVDMPATQARVSPSSYSEAMMLVPDACFEWPNAPMQDGQTHNLRTTPDGSYSRYTAQLIDRKANIGYVAISNPRVGLLVLYVFRRSDFPWIGNWEERFSRTAAPWNGNTFCRGLEFSSTPFAVPRRQTVSQGPLFNEATYRWLPANSEIAVRFLALLVDIPPDFQGVDQVSIESGNAIIHEHQKQRIFSLPIDGSFLTGGFSDKP
jgi:hypothetical protein